MDLPFFGSQAPRFRIASNPELSSALNLISSSVDKNDYKVPKNIIGGVGVTVSTCGDAIAIGLTNDHSVQTNNGKFLVNFLTAPESLGDTHSTVINVSTGTVGFVVGDSIVQVVPKLKGKRIYNFESELFDKTCDHFAGPYFLTTESFTDTSVLLKVDTKEGDAEIVLHDLSTTSKPNPERDVVFFELATIKYVTGELPKIDQKWSSDLFLPNLKYCPFALSDASEVSVSGSSLELFVKVQNTKIYQGGGENDARYPQGMGETWDYLVEQEKVEEWQAVYVVMEFDRATKRLAEYEGAVYISFEKEYKDNTETLQYEFIGEVVKSTDDDNGIYISYISNSCGDVVPDFEKLKSYCPFEVTDITERDETGTVTEVKISIRPDWVDGRLPNGMVEGQPYILAPDSSVFGRGRFNVYLKLMLDETGAIANYPDAISIQLTKYEKASGSAIKWYQIAQVITSTYDSNIDVIDNIINLCPTAYSELPNGCSFEIEDATDEEGIKTQIRIGLVNDSVYPVGMVEGQVFQMVVPDPAVNWYAVYITVLLDGNSKIRDVENAVTLSYEEDYKKSNALVEYILLGEISISSRFSGDSDEDGSGGRYISYIQNYCNGAITPERQGCFFEVVDASPEPDDLKILIRNDTVNWTERYPDNMDASTTYVIDLADSDPWYVVYVVMDVDQSTGNIKGDPTDEGYCYIEVANDYKPYRDGDKFYFQIAEVNIGYDENSKRVIDYISNTCIVPNYVVDEQYCPFKVTDRSTYDSEGESTNCVVKVQNDYVEGYRYPDGMSEDPDSEYILVIEPSDLDSAGVCHIFLRLEFDVNGKLETYDAAVTFQKSAVYLTSGARTKFILVAKVETERGGKIVPRKIVNLCPIVSISSMESCPFQIEDASWGGELYILIGNGMIGGVYPYSMNETDRFTLTIPNGTSSPTWYAVYAKIKLNQYGLIDYEDEKAIEFVLEEDYVKSNAYFQYSLIGEVNLSDDGTGTMYISNIQNYCYTPTVESSNNCPFEAVDATVRGICGVVIRNGRIEGKYPAEMDGESMYYVETPHDWNAIYAVILINDDGTLLNEEGSIYFTVEDSYVEAEEGKVYELIAEVTCTPAEGGGKEISFIQNYCYVPYLTKFDQGNCPFKATDYSTYNDQGEPTDCKLKIQNDTIEGYRYPNGMSKDTDFVIEVLPEDCNSAGVCYVFLRLELDEYGRLEDYETAVTFQKSDKYLESTSRTKWVPVCFVETHNGAIVPSKIANYCPVVSPSAGATCPFEIEDAFTRGATEVIIRTGKIGGRYPRYMAEGGKFKLGLDPDNNWYGIYAVLTLNHLGQIGGNEDDIEFTAETEYRKSNAYYQYSLIGEVTISTDSKGDRYISNITNYCYVPEVPATSTCPFECVDATIDNTAGIVIRNELVDGVYPADMTATGMFYVETPDPWNAIYLVIMIDPETGATLIDEGSVYFTVENEYVESTEDKLYNLIAEVNTDNGEYVTFIKNYCYVPSNSGDDLPEYCPFKATDFSTYNEEGEPTDCRIKIQNDTIQGYRYPYGMSENVDYIIDVDAEDCSTAGICYIFLRVEQDEYGRLEDYDAAVTFQKSDKYLESTSRTKFFPICFVETVGGVIVPSKIANYCPLVKPSVEDTCPFQVEDAYTQGGTEVIIRNGKIGDRYPRYMQEGGKFKLGLDSSNEWYGIYLVFVLDHNGQIANSEEAIEFTAETEYRKSNAYFQYSLIAEVSISSDEKSNRYISNVTNYCYVPEVESRSTCPFECVDATIDQTAGIVIRNGLVDGVYPAEMTATGMFYLETPDPWNAIYLVIMIDPSTGATLTEDGSVYFSVENEYTGNTEDKIYNIIAEVNTDNGEAVTFIKNYCYVPSNEITESSYCPFKLTDYSTYDDNGESTNCVVKVQNDLVDGRMPLGMSWETDYILTINSEDIDSSGVAYVFLRLELNSNGELEPYETAITFQKSNVYLTSGARTQFIVVGKIETERGGKIVPSKIVNFCPIATASSAYSCPFQVEDSSWGGAVKVVVNNGMVDGGYPLGMTETGRYEITLQSAAGWSAIYIVTKLNYLGFVDWSDTDAVKIEVFDDYQKSNAFYQYDVIAEVTVSDDGGGGAYVSFIQNYCYSPTITSSANCAFECLDATIYGSTTVAGIVIRNGKIEGKYPAGMTETGMFYLETPDDWNAIYAVISINPDGSLLDADGAIYFTVENEYKDNTESLVYELIAEVNVYDGAVTYIKNYCYEPYLTSEFTSNTSKCLFHTSDWSDTALKIKIQESSIRVGLGRLFPDGMGSGQNNYVLTLPTDGYWFPVYLVLGLDENYIVSTASFEVSTTGYKQDLSDVRYHLVSEVYLGEVLGTKYISKIENACGTPNTDFVPACPFDISKASNTSPLIQVRNGTLRGHFPDGMAAGTKYKLLLEYSWSAIYIVYKVDDAGVLKTETGDCTIGVYDNYQTSTATTKFFLIGEVSTGTFGEDEVVTYIVNTCGAPQFLAFGSDGGEAGANSCPFQLIDVSFPTSTGELDLQVKISKGMINNRWPSGMSLTSADYVLDITGNCYIYAVLAYKTDDVDLLDEETAITFEKTTTPKVNTASIQYELVGTVVISSGGPANGYYISSLTSVCGRIEAKPCSLAWTAGTGS